MIVESGGIVKVRSQIAIFASESETLARRARRFLGGDLKTRFVAVGRDAVGPRGLEPRVDVSLA